MPDLLQDESISTRTLDAFGWHLLAESSKFALQVGVQIALAWLLPVESFGLLAIGMIVVNVGVRVSEMGIPPALIQRASITDTHIRVAFSCAIVGGVLVSLGAWFAAPLLAAAFRAPEATPVLRAVALIFMVTSLGATSDALLQRRMDYRRLFRVELVAYALGYATVGLVLARLHYGIWALVWALMAHAALRSVLLIRTCPHPARPCFSRAETRDLLRFGVGVTLGRLASLAAQNGDGFVVGRWLGMTALGFYSRAYQFMLLPIYQFPSILNMVLFPAYSAIQQHRDRVRRGYLGSICLCGLLVFPVFTVMAIVAPELVASVLGPRWMPSSAPLRVLCLAGVFYGIYFLSDSLVRALGAVYSKFACHCVHAAVIVGASYVGARYGLVGVAWGMVAATMVVYGLMADLSLRLTHATWRSFGGAQLPGLVVAGLVAIVQLPCVSLLRALQFSPGSIFGIAATSGALVAVAAILAIPRAWLNAGALDMIDAGTRRAAVVADLIQRRFPPQAA